MAVYENKKVGSNFNIQKKGLSRVQKVIIGVILVAFGLVCLIAVNAILSTPENITKAKLEELAVHYYEDFIYEKMVTYGENHDFNEAMEGYEEMGFSAIYLRQLVHFADGSHVEAVNYLKEHCDLNKTAVKIYPKYPYMKDDYRLEYNYSCDFE